MVGTHLEESFYACLLHCCKKNQDLSAWELCDLKGVSETGGRQVKRREDANPVQQMFGLLGLREKSSRPQSSQSY